VLGLGFVMGATEAASAASSVGTDVAPAENNSQQHTGYRETDAVKAYYRAARF